MKNIETITVYITTKNRLELLRRAVASVLKQTRKVDELIIVDDGSDDGTAEYLEKIAQEHHCIVVIRNNHSRGACYARNQAINAATCLYITGLDDDDEFATHRLAVFMGHKSKLENQFAALSTGILLHSKNRRTKRRPALKQVNTSDLLVKNYVGNQVFTYTRYLKSIGGFSVDMPALQDQETWVRLTQRYGAVFCIRDFSYSVRVDHDYSRITQPTNRSFAIKQFEHKYEKLMTSKARKATNVFKIIYGQKKMTSSFIMRNYIWELNYEILSYYLQKRSKIIAWVKQMRHE